MSLAVQNHVGIALDEIVELWGEMTASVSKVPGARGGGGVLLDDHSEREDDLPRLDRVVSARCEVVAVLNGWCRLVLDEATSNPAAPDGLDALSMCAFLKRYVSLIAEHDAGQDCADELREAADKVRRFARPDKARTVYLGECPYEAADSSVCGGRVATLDDDVSQAECRRCGALQAVAEWEHPLGVEHRLLNTTEAVAYLHARGITVKGTQSIHVWMQRGLPRSGTDPKGKPLIHPVALLGHAANLYT